MSESPEQVGAGSSSLSMGASGAAGGGLLVVIGVLIAWWAVSGGGSVKGTEDFSGWAALIVALVGIVTAGMSTLMSDTSARKPAATLTMVCGLLVVLATLVGFFRGDSVAGADASLEPGLYVSFFGGLVMAVGGYLAGKQNA